MADLENSSPADESLLGVLRTLCSEGYTADLQAIDEDGTVSCGACKERIDAADLEDVHQRRLEGASDPADMMLVVTARCPGCDEAGTLVLSYGPEAGAADAAVLDRLPEATEDGQVT